MPQPDPFFCEPDVLLAIALSARDDPDLPDGVHIRVLPSPLLGFPIAPLQVYRAESGVNAETKVQWFGTDGSTSHEGNLDDTGGVLIGTVEQFGGGNITTAIEFPDADLTSIELLDTVLTVDRVPRVMAAVSSSPFIVGGPKVRTVRVTGRGLVGRARTWHTNIDQYFEENLLESLSLPIDGNRPWYVGGEGEPVSFDRVSAGAPNRLTLPDRPKPPFDVVSRNDEVARVRHDASDIVSQCEGMLGDPVTPPTSARLVPPPDDAPEFGHVDMAAASTLFLRAQDPGVGRYLGLVSTPPVESDWWDPTTIAVAGLFVVDPDRPTSTGGRLGDRLPGRDALTDRLLEQLHARDLAAEILGRGLGLEVRGLITVVAAVRPPDPPTIGAVTAGGAQWNDAGDVVASTFTQDLLVPNPPLGALLAIARYDGGWTTRHSTVELPAPADPTTRAEPVLLGRTIDGASAAPVGLVTDNGVPADVGGKQYRVALADLFGRFGPSTELSIVDPVRPPPPTPAPRTRIVDVDVDVDAAGAGAVSPGSAQINVVVPAIRDLTRGSLPITSLEVVVTTHEGTSELSIPVTDPGRAEDLTADVALPKLDVGGTGSLSLTARFVDSAGTASTDATSSVPFVDRRRPPVIPTGLGLYWSSRPSVGTEVEVGLTWPGTYRYRVYLADARTLGLALADKEGRRRTRADVAVDGGKADQAGTLGNGEFFRLLTAEPLTPVDGQVSFTTTLPRSLEPVQFLRVVPVTEHGKEAEFDTCGVVAVAVPSDRAPASPGIRAHYNGHTTVLVEASPLDPDALPQDPAAAPPEYRLRRSATRVADPIYARVVAHGPLTVHAEDARTVGRAEVIDPEPLLPFVRYSYWVEVRYPPERHLPVGFAAANPDCDITPADPANALDIESRYSEPSTAATILTLPDTPPTLLLHATAALTVEAGQSSLTLVVPSPPLAHSLAIGPYRLHIWERWPGRSIALAADIATTAGPLTWTGSPHPEVVDGAELFVAVIDPVGRTGVIQSIHVDLPN